MSSIAMYLSVPLSVDSNDLKVSVVMMYTSELIGEEIASDRATSYSRAHLSCRTRSALRAR